MISYFEAVTLGLLQGITELFPISSLGHSILLPGLLGWQIDQKASYFLEFLVATHLATAIVLFVIYREDWIRIVRGMFRSLQNRSIETGGVHGKLGWLLVVGTIPAGLVGILFEEEVKHLFASPRFAAIFLIANGILLFAAESLRRRRTALETTRGGDERIAELTWFDSLKVGAMEALALLPGISRTGSTIAGGLWIGLSHEDSLRFSFLLATPVIGAAAILEIPQLLSGGNQEILAASLLGALAAALAAYFSVKFLVRYFKTKTLVPFAIYCLFAGSLSLLLLR